MIITFRIRRDTAANWSAANPVLALGEPGVETDTRRVKYGDGMTAWTALGYASAVVAWGGITGDLTDQADLTAALNAKLAKTANLSDLANVATARTNLGLGSLALKSTINDSDWSGTDLSVANGGTGASTATAARTALGIGSLGTQNANSAAITGGSITGLTAFALGAIGAVYQGMIGLSTTFLRMRERSVADDFALSTNINDNGGQDAATKPAWVLRFGAGSDSFIVQRAPPGAASIATLFEVKSATTRLATARVIMASLATYATDSAAGTGGLSTGDLYKTSDGAGGFYLKIKA